MVVLMMMMLAMMMMIATGKDQREYTTALTACRDVSQSQLSPPLPSSFWYNDGDGDDENDGDGDEEDDGGGDDDGDGDDEDDGDGDDGDDEDDGVGNDGDGDDGDGDVIPIFQILTTNVKAMCECTVNTLCISLGERLNVLLLTHWQK